MPQFLLHTGDDKAAALAEQTPAVNKLLHITEDQFDLGYLTTCIFLDTNFPTKLKVATEKCLDALPDHGLLPSFLHYLNSAECKKNQHTFYTFGTDISHLGQKLYEQTKGDFYLGKIVSINAPLHTVKDKREDSIADARRYNVFLHQCEQPAIESAFLCPYAKLTADTVELLTTGVHTLHNNLLQHSTIAIQASFPVFSLQRRHWSGGKIVPVDTEQHNAVVFFDDNISLNGTNVPGCVHLVDKNTGQSIDPAQCTQIDRANDSITISVGKSVICLKKAPVVDGLLEEDYFAGTIKQTQQFLQLRKLFDLPAIAAAQQKSSTHFTNQAGSTVYSEIKFHLEQFWQGKEKLETVIDTLRDSCAKLTNVDSPVIAALKACLPDNMQKATVEKRF